MKLYLDANAIIYAVEGSPVFRAAVVNQIQEARRETGGCVVSSQLSLLECRVKPVREENAALLRVFDQFFSHDGFELIPIDEAVLECATNLRVQCRFRTPDAIHLATAITSGADLFLTGDAALSKCSEIKVHIL